MTDNSEDNKSTRRDVLLGGIAAGIAALVGYASNSATAQADPSGDVGRENNPYRRAYVDRVVFSARTSDPSDPPDGTLWYNEEA